MSVKNFKFVSPGVFINEIDNSFIPKTAQAIGPVVIGRASRGLAMQPVQVSSYADFVEMFGDTVPGRAGGDHQPLGRCVTPRGRLGCKNPISMLRRINLAALF